MNTSKRIIGKISLFAIYLLMAFVSNSCAQTKSNNESKVDEITKLVNTYAEYGEFNGAVLVATEGEIIYHQGLGFANMEWEIPNRTDTKFRIGSITKQFTVMLIMQLASEKKLDLHTPISTYLPNYPKENADKITIHHLLTHTSGTPNSYESKKKEAIRPDNYQSEELVNEFSSLPLEFTPGEKFSYSNAGYTLLGYIIETVTQQRYEQVLQEKIFEPLGMVNSGFDKHRTLIKNRAYGYFKNWGEYYNSNYIDMSTVYAAGALYSTVDDLFLWDQALYTNQLVPKEYLDLIFTPHIPDPDYGGDYGYGWSIKNKYLGNSKSKIQTIGHDGVIDGFCSVFTRIPSSKSSIILLSNIRRAPLNAMTKAIMGILYNKPYDLPKKSVAYSFLKVIDSKGIEEGIRHYESIKNAENHYLAEDEINIISYKLLQSDRAKEAAAVLKLGIEVFPKAFNLYDSYGEVLLGLGDTINSVENYKKSIELNPKNENGLKVLEKLGVNTSELVNFNLLKTDKTWGQETFTFPIHFAAEINYTGVEEARFPKGWAKQESDEFWSYSFAWSINSDLVPTKKELETNIQLYFDGLMKGVNKDKNKKLPKTNAEFKKEERTNTVFKYTGQVSIYDAFTTKNTLILNAKIETHHFPEKNKSIIVFKFSPKQFGSDIWLTLDEIRLKDTILNK